MGSLLLAVLALLAVAMGQRSLYVPSPLVPSPSTATPILQGLVGQVLPLKRAHAVTLAPNSPQKRGTSSISEVGFGHGSYFVTISLGAINLQVALDTGSSDLWVLSSDCKSANCLSLPSYPLSFRSPTFLSVNNNQTAFSASYADATSVSGFVAQESVHLANVTIPNQSFALVNTTSITFHDRVSGVLGLGFSRLSAISQLVPQASSFIAGMAKQGFVSYPFFGLGLTANGNGTITFGAVDGTLVRNTSLIVWHPVVPFAPPFNKTSSIYLHWALEISKMMINGAPLTLQPTYQSVTRSSIALIDVGTEGIFGPVQDVTRIFSMLDPDSRLVGDGQWVVPCSINATMTFLLGNQRLILEPSDYIIGRASGAPDECLAWPRATAPSADGIDWQFGTPVLRTVYSVFSYGIDSKEPPMIGLLALNMSDNNPTDSLNTTSTKTSSFVPITTVQTTLPNEPLITPTFTTPPYLFNTSAGVPTVGQRVSSDLATKAYSPILLPLNSTAIPTILPNETIQTFLITDKSGMVHTSVVTATVLSPSLPLGGPSNFAHRPVAYDLLPLCMLLCIATFQTFL